MNVDANQSGPTLDEFVSGKTPTDELRVLLQSNRVGRFALIRELGAGGMGSVFAAYDEQLDRKVALKILRGAQAGDETQRQSTLREARAAARISHPNVISIYEVGEAGGMIHIAMEYVEGHTLLKWQAERRRDWHDIVAMYLQVGEALLAAHSADVVHRDFKPDNVLIGPDGRPRVVDFGLARVGWVDPQSEPTAPLNRIDRVEPEADARASGRLTLPGIISGTPGYMSPEQYRGGDVDSRSDQWSFCAALFEALYGYLPFSGKTLAQRFEKLQGPPKPPPADTKVPVEIHRALCRGLAPNPEQRFPSMAELLAVLGQEAHGEAGAGSLSRLRISRALIVIPILVMVAILVRRSGRVATPRDAVMATAIGLTVLLLGGLWQRRALISNRFHRHVWIILLVGGVQNLLQRLLSIVLDIPITKLFAFEMIVLAGCAAILTTTVFRNFRFLPLLPLVAGILAVTTSIPRPVLAPVYPILMILFVIAWSRAARGVPTSGVEKNAGLGTAPRGRPTPT